MKTLIVYDSTGRVIMTSSGSETYEGVVGINYEVPEGKIVASVDVLSGEPILEDKPLNEYEQQIADLQSQIDSQSDAILALMEAQQNA